MFKSYITLAIAAVTAAEVSTQNLEVPQDEEYQVFSDAMDLWGYGWEAFKVTTDDGFILTTFHITEKFNYTIPRDPTLAPVMMMQGYLCDATAFVAWAVPGENKPEAFRLFDDGFEVFLASNRATKYCQEHLTLDINTPEYWDWSWA